jgi:two-component system response regulator ResD
MGKILLVDDAKETHLVLQEIFDQEHTMKSAYDLAQATMLLDQEPFDLVLLDIMLPDGDGLEFCAKLRAKKSTKDLPVIFLTGKTDLAAKSIGFSLGAEDYIVKPFDAEEVKLRALSKIRKFTEKAARDTNQVIGDLRFEIPSQRVFLRQETGEKRLDFTPTGFKLLLHFCQNETLVFTRDQIITAVWGQGTFIAERTVDTHIGTVRKQLGDSRVSIQSVHGYGYKLSIAPVNANSDSKKKAA